MDRKQGHRVGFDVISGSFDPATGTLSIDVAVARHGGLLYANVHSDPSTAQVDFVGRVTGGSGRFEGASGTVLARNLDPQGSRTRVIVTYSLPG